MNDLQRAQEEIRSLRDRLAECEDTAEGKAAATQAKSFLERVRMAVANALVQGRPPIAAIARALHASPRTVQRRLRQQDTSYGELIDSVRRERVESLVTAGHLSITEIAFLAGFTDLSGFRRAYKRWTGLAPSDARARENGSKYFT